MSATVIRGHAGIGPKVTGIALVARFVCAATECNGESP